MRASKASKPLTTRGKVLVWCLISFVVLIGAGGGGSLIATGLDGRAAVSGGPVGAFTPTSRQCAKDGCSWTGDYVSEDGAITRTGVPLRDAERVAHNDPMPSRIDDVRLADDADRPAAYTADFDWAWSIGAGVFLLVFCLVTAGVLIRVVRRYRS